MAFDEDAMEAAYKCLEGTERFCDLGNKKLSFFSNSSLKAEQLSAHEKLHRRAIIADCILFEAILVFLKQGLTSYVKGGYLLRKAYKMYQKIYQETEKLCKQPSPISRPGMTSPVDRHVGSSIYDPDMETNDEQLPDQSTMEEVGENLSSLYIGFSGFSVSESCSVKEGGEVCQVKGV